jgi:hypothetical protein
MRAVTRMQVAQHIIILAYKQLDNPVAAFSYGQQIAKISTLEAGLIASKAELSGL